MTPLAVPCDDPPELWFDNVVLALDVSFPPAMDVFGEDPFSDFSFTRTSTPPFSLLPPPFLAIAVAVI
jgi:hypothetical protein